MNAIEVLMQECNNYFYKTYEHDTFAINNGVISTNGIYLPNQYIKIEGSILNDGVYKVESMNGNHINIATLQDEIFEGCIFGLSVPKGFIELSEKVNEFLQNPKAVPTNISSESFNNYSWSKGKKSNGANITWNDVFTDDIRSFRQLYDNKRRCVEVKKYSVVTSLEGGVIMTDDTKGIEVV